MKNFTLFFSLVVITQFYSCSKETDPDPEPEIPFLTVAVSSNYPNNNNLWAFVTNSEGKTVMSKKLTIGLNPFVSDQSPDVITLTLLQYGQDVQSFYTFSSYTNISANSTVSLVQSNGFFYSMPSQTGTAKVEVINYTASNFDVPSIFVSDGYSSNIINNPGISSNTSLILHKSPVDILVSSHSQDNSNPVYTWINGAENGNNLSVDFATFKPFANTIVLPASEVLFASIGGYKTTAGVMSYHTFSNIFIQENSIEAPSRIGYLEGYDTYETEVRATVGLPLSRLKTTTYRKRGSINSLITMPDYSVTINNSSMTSFAYNYTGNSEFQLHSWGYDENNSYITWNVYSDGSDLPAFVEFPDELKTKFPILDFNKMLYKSSTFYHCTDGYSYEDYFTDMQTGKYPFDNPEYHEVAFRQY